MDLSPFRLWARAGQEPGRDGHMQVFWPLPCHQQIQSREECFGNERGIVFNNGHMFGAPKKDGRACVGVRDYLKVTTDAQSKFVKCD